MTAIPDQDKRIELKYLLDEQLSLSIREWARGKLEIDPHCNKDSSSSYEVSSLYLDTADFDFYHRSRAAGRTRYRIRRYGAESVLWLESKSRRGDVVRKNRTAVDESLMVEQLARTSPDSATLSGNWFMERIAELELRPAVLVHYRRFARTSNINNECLRLTIDSHLRSSHVDGWRVRGLEGSEFHCGESEVLELKFHNRMPPLFQELLRTFDLVAKGFSKYRVSVMASGLEGVISSSGGDGQFGKTCGGASSNA